MTYIAVSPKLHALTVNGIDYTDALISFQVADSTAERQGLIVTRGSVVLAWESKDTIANDYRRLSFQRGQRVIVDIKQAGEAPVRHPRGRLYILSVSYDPKADTLTLEVGCRLALIQLTDDVDKIIDFVEIPLSEERQTFSNISSALALTGHVVYQDNQGDLIKRRFFPNGLWTGANITGSWVSVFGQTALDVSPLAQGEVLPDGLELAYQLPVDVESKTGDVQIDTTISRYYMRFPIKTYERKPPEEGVPGIGDSSAAPVPPPAASDCGNSPDPPTDPNDLESCSAGFTAVDTTKYIYAEKITTQRTEYKAGAQQVSRVLQEVRGPALEVNTQYYTDKYAYCIHRYGSACNPSGFCSPDGTFNTLQARSETINFYGADNELVKTVTTNYRNVGSAAQPTDWRSSTVEGESGLQLKPWEGYSVEAKITSGVQYRDSIVIDEFKYFDDGTEQTTTTWSSPAGEGIGIQWLSDLDAMSGIKTVQVRRSRTISANPTLPDRLNNKADQASQDLEDVTDYTPIFRNAYVEPPDEAGPYNVQEGLPVELSNLTRDQILDYVEYYKQYLVAWYKGKARGLTLSEVVRPELITDWRPGMRLWFHDPIEGVTILGAMDGTSWAIESDGCVCTFTAVWLGYSRGGTFDAGSNTTGSQTRPVHPDPPEGAPPGSSPAPTYPPKTPPPLVPLPPAVVTPPAIEDQTGLDNGPIVFYIPVTIGTQATVTLGGVDESGIVVPWPSTPDGNILRNNVTTTCYVNAQIVAAGSLIGIEGAGGIPISANNILLTESATIIDPDLFS